jgi:chromosome segregation ATPase
MSELEKALDRLSSAVSTLLDASERGRAEKGAHVARLAALEAERDSLRAELSELRAAREEDARLRAEAAEAVKAALRDLRTILAVQEEEAGRKAAAGGRNA